MLTGAANFRAVKSYAGADGRYLRPGIFYRSGELSRLSAEDLAVLAGLNIRLVCDLRSQREQAEYVSRWPDGSLHRHLDVPNRDSAGASPENMFRLITSEAGAAGAEKAMAFLYRRKPRAYAPHLQQLFAAILAGDALPLLVHCHAGKDRTGFIVAMLLAAAGVAHDDILDDYETTAKFFPVEPETRAMVAWAKRSYGHDLTLDSARPMAEARRDYIETAFAEVEASHGGIARYLAESVGLSEADIARYRHLVLD